MDVFVSFEISGFYEHSAIFCKVCIFCVIHRFLKIVPPLYQNIFLSIFLLKIVRKGRTVSGTYR